MVFTIIANKDIYLDTQHPQGQAGLEAVQDTEEALANRYKRQSSGPEDEFAKPLFVVPLEPQFNLGESEPLHLECQVEPKNDPNLKVEWYFNGKSLDHGKLYILCEY
jgi:titin